MYQAASFVATIGTGAPWLEGYQVLEDLAHVPNRQRIMPCVRNETRIAVWQSLYEFFRQTN